MIADAHRGLVAVSGLAVPGAGLGRSDLVPNNTTAINLAGGAAVFLPASDPLTDTRPERNGELRRLNLQYGDRLEFAIGCTCSVDWTVADGARRASEVCTTSLPTCQTPQTTAEEIGDALLDMTVLATGEPSAAARRAGAQEEPVCEQFPVRRYLGLSTTGVQLTTAEIRVAEVLMAAGQLLRRFLVDGPMIPSMIRYWCSHGTTGVPSKRHSYSAVVTK